MLSTHHELLARDSNQAHPRSPKDLVLQAQHHKHKNLNRSRICLALPKCHWVKNPHIPPGVTPHVAMRHITIFPKLSHCVGFAWRVNSASPGATPVKVTFTGSSRKTDFNLFLHNTDTI